MKSKSSGFTFLMNPFHLIAGGKAFLIGLGTLLLLSWLGYLSGTHFDGVLDIHYGCLTASSPYIVHLFYQLCAWGIMTALLYFAAWVMSASSVRLIDIAGTSALARIPLILAALTGFIPEVHICPEDSDSLTAIMSILKDNIAWISLTGIICILVSVWYIVLLYNAFSVSGNMKGPKGILTFIVALLIGEVISKILIYILVPLFI